MKRDILIATGNAGKAREFSKLFGDAWRTLTLKEAGIDHEVVEDGDTFEANAEKKAVEISRMFEGLVVADDSGLEVDALDGAPGVYSARYAGEPKDDKRNNAKLLKTLQGVVMEKRGAQFHCVLVLAQKGGVLATFSGICRGHILETEQGAGGFGYDPMFVPEGFDKTFGELPSETKNRISHRSKAMAGLNGFLQTL